ncbi:hypothetical protein AAGF08_04370 [Algoriphagus sp. SE2]|uniref:hypothetical protein n=1 Tax=Algoriphagus sp. SE2 TaxID=3141536 RepID=UPI0031CD1ED6
MNSILINPKNEKELNFISELLAKLGARYKIITAEEKEDLGLSHLMVKVKRDVEIPKEEVLKKLLQHED